MSQRRTIRTSTNSVRPTHRCHPMTVRLQSSSHPLPICDQSPMLDQSDVNPFQSSVNQVPIHPNTMLIKCKIPCTWRPILSRINKVPIHPNQMLIPCQSEVNPIRIQRQSDANLIPTRCQSCVNLTPNKTPTLCQSGANVFRSGANLVPIHPNLISIQSQSSANQVPIKRQLIPILCQSGANPVPLNSDLMPIQYQSYVKQTPIHPNCQSQPSANAQSMPTTTHHQNTGQMSILDQ